MMMTIRVWLPFWRIQSQNQEIVPENAVWLFWTRKLPLLWLWRLIKFRGIPDNDYEAKPNLGNVLKLCCKYCLPSYRGTKPTNPNTEIKGCCFVNQSRYRAATNCVDLKNAIPKQLRKTSEQVEDKHYFCDSDHLLNIAM